MVAAVGPLADTNVGRHVVSTRQVFEGRVWNVRSDDVDLGGSGRVTRDYVDHPGAVAVMALNDRGEVYLVHQYRHPVRRELWEPPAGLLDVKGEDPLTAAKRELWEEADLLADTWHVLVDFATSPGGSSERIRVFLAQDVRLSAADDRHVREAEERDMVGAWVQLDEVLTGVLEGRIWAPTTVVGAFALDAARRAGFSTLRAVDAPWGTP